MDKEDTTIYFISIDHISRGPEHIREVKKMSKCNSRYNLEIALKYMKELENDKHIHEATKEKGETEFTILWDAKTSKINIIIADETYEQHQVLGFDLTTDLKKRKDTIYVVPGCYKEVPKEYIDKSDPQNEKNVAAIPEIMDIMESNEHITTITKMKGCDFFRIYKCPNNEILVIIDYEEEYRFQVRCYDLDDCDHFNLL